MSFVYHFQGYELDSAKRELRHEGQSCRVQPRPLDLLLHLVRHRDRVVAREELLESVWRGVRVNDEALGYAVHQARRAVRDDGASQRIIRTFSGRGYRFVAEVSVDSGNEGTAADGFVGRKWLLEDLHSTLEQAMEGSGSLLLLSGEAGIGKTRSAERALVKASAMGFRAFGARCLEVDGAPAFWPWIQLFQQILKSMPSSNTEASFGAGGPELARLIPELRDHGLIGEQDVSDDPAAARFLLFDSARRLVHEAAVREPMMLMIDDLHRADRSSLLLLRHLSRELGSERVVLLVTHREAELAQDKLRGDLVAELLRLERSRALALPGMAPEEVAEFVSVASGQPPSDVVAADLHQRTNGNPFFVRQVLQALQAGDRARDLARDHPLSITLPRHAQEAIAQQVSGLPVDVRRFLEIASVIGRDFSARVLQSAADAPSAQLLDALDLAVRVRVIEADGARPEKFSFAHVLLRDALYEGLGSEQRAAHHRRVGEALLRLEQAKGVPADPSSLAYHFFEGARGVDSGRAVDLCMAAGRWSEQRFAFDEAVASYERALALCDHDGRVGDQRRGEILLAIGGSLTGAGRRDDARECFQMAARMARSRDMPEQLAAAALRFAPDFLAIETGICDVELINLLEEALAMLPDSDTELRARVAARLAVALHWAPGSRARRASLCSMAEGIARRVGCDATLRYVECANRLAFYSVDDVAKYACEGNVDKIEREHSVVLLGQLLRITSLLQMGRLEQFEREVEHFGRAVQRYRQPQALWYVDLFRATRALLLGELDDADVLMESYRQEGGRANDWNAIQSWQIQSYMLSIDRGAPEAFEQGLCEMVESFPRLLGWRAGLALLYAELGAMDKAALEIDRVLELGLEGAPKRNEWSAAIAALASASVEVGHARGLELTERLLRPHAGQLVVVGYGSFCWGPVDTLLGAAALGRGELESADVWLRSSAIQCERLEAAPALARCRVHQARLALAQGRRDIAERSAAEAFLVCDRVGLARLGERARALTG